MKGNILLFFGLVCWICFAACDKNEHPLPPDSGNDSIRVTGTGSFLFQAYAPLKAKPIRVWYHIPVGSDGNSPIMIAFTGANRDAMESRDKMIQDANKKNVMVFVPEFNDSLYPKANQYNLGYMFINGEKPSTSTLIPEEQWTFSAIEPIFDYIKQYTGYSGNAYDAFGHSAGAQFLHRYLQFKPQNRIRNAVAASSGWYTMPDPSIDFPYGLGFTPYTQSSIDNFFSFPLYVCVGDKDTDPNSAGLRHTTEADAQGLNRYERAQYFFNESKTMAGNASKLFQWQFRSIPNADHDYALTSSFAMNLLYP